MFKNKMNNRVNMPLVNETQEPKSFLKESRIDELLELCIDSKSKNEFENILTRIWDEWKKCILEKEEFYKFDIACIYALNYVYENYAVPPCAVLRSLYAYFFQIHATRCDLDTNMVFKRCQDRVINELRLITNSNTFSKCEKMLVDIGVLSIIHGNVALTRFLIKYGLTDFPLELNEECKRMIRILVNPFNDSFKHALKNKHVLNERTTIQSDDMLNLVNHSGINFRRFLLTFCTIILVSQYSTYNVKGKSSRSNSFNECMTKMCDLKFVCLNLFIDATTETYITFQDIKNFIANFIDPLLHADVGRYLLECFRRRFSESLDYYNPRSLKDLTRCKVRANLQNSTTFPKQVSQLHLPASLKYFLLFHGEGILKALKLSDRKYKLERKLMHRESRIHTSILALREPVVVVYESILDVLRS